MPSRYEQAQSEEAARRLKVQEQQAARRQELDYFQALEQQRAEEQAARDVEASEFEQRVQSTRAAGATVDPSKMQTLDSYFLQRGVQEEAEAKAQRKADRENPAMWNMAAQIGLPPTNKYMQEAKLRGINPDDFDE